MITLLFAEDEFYTRKGLIKHLDFKALGIDQVLEAEDGRAALRLAGSCGIDILLTDVKMPHMDGIELAKGIRALYPECIILFLSGYSDREYLRGALSLRTFRYLDKPVDMNLLQEVLTDAVRLCRRMKNSVHYGLEELRKQFARLLISHTPHRNPDYTEYLEPLGLTPASFGCCRTVLVQLLNGSTVSPATDFSPTLFETCKFCEHFYENSPFTALVSEYKEQYILIHLLSSDPSSCALEASGQSLLAGLSRALSDRPHFIAAGPPAHDMYGLRASYAGAVACLQQNYYLGMNSISPVADADAGGFDASHEIWQAVCQAVISQDAERCMALLEQLYSQYRSHPATLVSNTRATYYRLLHWLYQYHFRKNITDSMHNESYLLDKVTGTSTLKELHLFTIHYFQNHFEQSGDSTDNQLARRITGIIRNNYDNPDLGIPFICEQLQLSASHVSGLFKNVTGGTINQYIQDIRIDHARVLLTSTSLQIQEIGRKCGYPDSNYFTKLFRSKTGLLPSQYREVHST